MNAPTTVSPEKTDIAAAPFARGLSPLDDRCFRNTGRLFLADDGSYYALEWTPTLNDEELSGDQLVQLIEDCPLAGGGWQVPTREELLTSADSCAWSSGRVWFVNFSSGGVGAHYPGYGGFARGVRRVPVSPGQ